MRLGWTKTKYSISYYVQKTIYVDGKNKSMKADVRSLSVSLNQNIHQYLFY